MLYNFRDNPRKALMDMLSAEGRLADGIRVALTMLLIIMAAKPAAELTWKLLPSSRSVAGQPESRLSEKKNKNVVPGASGNAAGSSLVAPKLHLFGKPGRVSIMPVSDSDTLPKTTLDLMLKGIIIAAPMEKALAIINKRGEKEEDGIYAIGDQLPGKAIIREIYADRVVLMRAGKLETLMLGDEESGTITSGRQTTITSRGDGVHWDINNSYWQQRISDVTSIAKEVGLEIYRQGKSQRGYRLISSRGSAMLDALGLQPGDILYSVNGIQLTNAHQGLTAYEKLKNTAKIRVEIGRKGRRMTRIYSINADS